MNRKIGRRRAFIPWVNCPWVEEIRVDTNFMAEERINIRVEMGQWVCRRDIDEKYRNNVMRG